MVIRDYSSDRSNSNNIYKNHSSHNNNYHGMNRNISNTRNINILVVVIEVIVAMGTTSGAFLTKIHEAYASGSPRGSAWQTFDGLFAG